MHHYMIQSLRAERLEALQCLSHAGVRDKAAELRHIAEPHSWVPLRPTLGYQSSKLA